MSINITHIASIRNETLPVYLKYEGQSKPQPAHVELTEDGVVTAGANPEIGNAVTMDVWHRRTMRWPIDPGLTGAQIADAIQEALPLLERIHAGHTVEFDGSNMGGLLTEDAAEASAKLGRLLEKIHSDVYVGPADDRLWTNDTAFERRSGDLTHEEILALFEGAKGKLHLRIELGPGTYHRAFQIIDVWDANAPERLVGWDIVTEGTIDTRLDEEGDWVTELAWAVLEECRDDWASITEFDDLIAGTNPAVVQG